MTVTFASESLNSRRGIYLTIGGASAVALSLALAPLPASPFGAAFAVVAAVIVRTDLRELRIPDAANVVGAMLGLAACSVEASSPWDVANALGRAAVMFGAFYAFRALYRYARGRDGFGLGDVKLAGVAGLWLEAERLPVCLELACASALGWLMWRHWARGAPIAGGDRLAFGAYFAPAIWAVWLWQAATG